ncbi:AMP-binding protein [Nostoc sp. CENA67]|uniref:AMP-binding protein n=1 Tax=Amazonocrinis nigriterrae CENA67 TaxID=2794033 RepID=A0A8J7HM75_9NOST|nr:condensation domain-containing protein [Amazonocrinis nigriterrae]MBH8561822.1 AMP-binding protein [Amazonocrinis nigriterrae CENA67]
MPESTTHLDDNCKKLSLRKFSTFVEILRYRSNRQSDIEAFTFLQDGETQAASLTYQELDRCSRAIAAQLQELNLSGERALLLYPPGLDYLAAFFGCLYAGVVAVPAYPPRNQRNTPRIQAIIADAQAKIALTTTALLPSLQSLLKDKADLNNLQWLVTDNLPDGKEEAWLEPAIDIDSLAFLQYTSGSTGTPKGVMLSHGNLLHNAAATYELMGHSPNSVFVSWLPTYHDMGLIGGILQPLYGGFPCILMPPASFLQRPYRWLQAISEYKGTTSGAPNFAYELCMQKITPEQKQTLDLSSWSVAFNGAEPIRHETLERFASSFADCGFRKQAFYPCYGMAEATLMIAGGDKAVFPKIKTVEKAALEQNQVIDKIIGEEVHSLVSCGQTLPQQQIVIANLETLTRCQPKEVGEIWVSGPSVGKGYWHRKEESKEVFQAFLSDTGEGPFLRTGDLGFLDNGEIYITGRAKDLIIIRGRNLYPQDIELTAERSDSSLRIGSGAAFAVEVENEERLVVVQELEFRAKPNLAEVTTAIRQAVAQEHEIQAYAVVLIQAGTIPKTSSGKIQRRACKAEFLNDSLQVVGKSILDSEEASLTQDRNSLTSYLQELIAQALKIPVSKVQTQQPLTALGIDSLIAFDLKNQIEVDFGVDVSINELLQDASIEQLTKQILTHRDSKQKRLELQPISRQGQLPLCLPQERLWFLEQLEPGNPFYNVAIAIQLNGVLNLDILQQSLNEIIQRHESLRTSFVSVEGQPVQIIHPSLDVKLAKVDCTYLDNTTYVENLILAETQQPFDLCQAPLLRTQILCIAENKHLLLLTMHHIISDGWSVGILIQELAALYQAVLENKPSPLSELTIQYADFAYWQRQWLQQENLKTQLNYWQQQLSNSPPLLQLPTDRPRPKIATFIGKKHNITLPQYLSPAVKELSQKEGVTVFMILLATFQTLLYSLSHQEDIVVGSPVAGRNHPQTQGLIGFFINTLVLRTNFSGNPTFRELLVQVKQVALKAYAHQDVPFEKLVEELQPKRNLSYNPLFQVMFIFQNAPIPSIELPGLTWQPQEVDSGSSKFDMKLSIWESATGFQGSFEYKTDLFQSSTISRIASHFELLLQSIVNQPDMHLQELAAMVITAEKEQQTLQDKALESISLQKLKLSKRTVIR